MSPVLHLSLFGSTAIYVYFYKHINCNYSYIDVFILSTCLENP